MPIPLRIELAACGGAAGLVAGSFLATLVLRWPAGLSVARGRSRCDGCGRMLSAVQLVPLLSFVAARGRCGACDTRIHRVHPAMEAGCALVGAAALAAAPGPEGAAGALLGWLLLTLAALDLGWLWLPDALTLPLLLLGLAAGLPGLPPPVPDRAIGCAAGFLLLELVRRGFRRWRGIDGMGRGDPKLLAAIGAWLGWRDLPLTLFAAACLGIVYALAVPARGRPLDRSAPVPFGAMLAAAGWGMWLAGAVLPPAS